MSYQETTSMANRWRYTPPDEMRFGNSSTSKNTDDDDHIFEIPLFGGKSTHEKAVSVKGGESIVNG